MAEVVKFAKVLSDASFMRVLNLLRNGELCACEIVEALQEKPNLVGNRLQKLALSGVVRVRRRDRWQAYEIDPRFTDLIETIFEVFEQDFGPNVLMARDETGLKRALRKRMDGWCVDNAATKRACQAQGRRV